MNSPVFVDTNVFMYAAGADHPFKLPSVAVLDLISRRPGAFVTDAEVFQEMLHRYTSLRRWSAAERIFHEHLTLMAGHIVPMLAEDVGVAAGYANRYVQLSARDLIHVAVMLRVGARYIVSADSAFNGVSEIERLDPAAVEEWRERVLSG